MATKKKKQPQRASVGKPRVASAALLAAVQQGDVAAVEARLAKGEPATASIAKDSNGLLWVRSLDNRAGVARALLRAGADVHEREHGESLLTSAAEFGHVELIEVLLEFGADVEDEGGLPLMRACRGEQEQWGRDCLQAVRLLAARGAALDAVHDWPADEKGRGAGEGTCLMDAVRRGREALALALLEAGADPKVQNARGESAASLARAGGLKKVLAALTARGVKAPSAGKKGPRGAAPAPAAPADHLPERLEGTVKPRRTKRAVHASGTPDVASVFEGRFPGCGNPPVHLVTLEPSAIPGLPKAVAKLGAIPVVHSSCEACDPLDFYVFQLRKDGRLVADRAEHTERGECDAEAASPSRRQSWIELGPEGEGYLAVGGLPRWVQARDDWVDCPRCGQRPFFLAQLWQHGLPRGAEGPGNHLYVFVCAPCKRVLVSRQAT